MRRRAEGEGRRDVGRRVLVSSLFPLTVVSRSVKDLDTKPTDGFGCGSEAGVPEVEAGEEGEGGAVAFCTTSIPGLPAEPEEARARALCTDAES